MKKNLIAAGIVTGTLLLNPSTIFADSISNVINMSQSQVENSVIGVITDADTYFATVEYQDSEGNIQTVEIDFPNESNKTFAKGDKVRVINKDKWGVLDLGYQKVTYAPGDYIFKLTSNTQVENSVIGVITDADTYFATVEYQDSEGNIQTVEIDFPNESNKTFAKGDKVRVINKDKWGVLDLGYQKVTYAPGDYIFKLTSNTQVENSVIGVITDADTYFATVEYQDSEGNIQTVEIDFPNESNKTFAKGDKVRVINKDKWGVLDLGYHKVTYAPGDFISKLTDDSK
ncbi:hypothetical protein [Paenibacillus thiaminolyticus]|uniref:Uncharacterized protein n=1 Tax=Paenibacillus thiaminolyticus TaxID=49283 RepID=A0A3A3H117_PANTH|nr:hypothetical protein [Paenibacillus thiaminolyticus]RJG22479.1 hypothetical protein DQX05_17655 [Paenibacillus thiaminolyticus]